MKSITVRAIDCWMAAIPRVTPANSVLQGCKIVSHRGEHDNREVMENTLRAYDIARTNGVWGIEVDIRWTADLVPVVCHDPDGGRVFGNPIIVGEKSFAELREAIPDI
ncbi:MAG: glycerophosphodiester phosphodiesterase family protein, partial [Pseudomonadota bacterium]|nr:glycerophosphodiester phosphodiesterase family protein [Pseudomonadota bacterium]